MLKNTINLNESRNKKRVANNNNNLERPKLKIRNINSGKCLRNVLLYSGNTCYADSVLMVLLCSPNIYLMNLINGSRRLTTNNSNKLYINLTINQNNEYRNKEVLLKIFILIFIIKLKIINKI